jgi:hypothetical protein
MIALCSFRFFFVCKILTIFQKKKIVSKETSKKGAGKKVLFVYLVELKGARVLHKKITQQHQIPTIYEIQTIF